jgi:hypothetical protein
MARQSSSTPARDFFLVFLQFVKGREGLDIPLCREGEVKEEKPYIFVALLAAVGLRRDDARVSASSCGLRLQPLV